MRVAALAVGLLLIILPAQGPAQTYQVLHAFSGELDGSEPWAGVTIDAAGNLYGTTLYAGSDNRGTVFKLKHSGSGWVFSPLYSFRGTDDGQFPEAPLTIAPDGTVYGTTTIGGASGYGTVFELRPPANPCRSVLCFWTETQLHSFSGSADGGVPEYGALVLDQAGNLYGTTTAGGANNGGVVYEFQKSDGSWTESVIYNLSAETTGIAPYSGLIFDSAGNLYGVTTEGGGGQGAVYQLTPSGSGWAVNTLFAFPVNGKFGLNPYGTLIFDPSGNLYGTTPFGGSGGNGTVYELTPAGGNWTANVLYNFSGYGNLTYVGVTRDAAGNLYGTTRFGGAYQHGTVFKLSPSGGEWTYTELYDFPGEDNGSDPFGAVTLDANGNLYGTAMSGGSNVGYCYPDGCGVIWEITP